MTNYPESQLRFMDYWDQHPGQIWKDLQDEVLIQSVLNKLKGGK